MKGPLEFTPRDVCRFRHRFDDPRKIFRTVYSSVNPVTCFKEVLAPLRSDPAAAEAFAKFGGGPPREALLEWRKDHVLAPATIHLLNGPLVHLGEDDEVLRQLLLENLGLQGLDAGLIQKSDRRRTQQIARFFFDQGCAGLVYESRVDEGELCIALFEGRARLQPAGQPRPLTEPVEELIQVCHEFGLLLEPPSNLNSFKNP